MNRAGCGVVYRKLDVPCFLKIISASFFNNTYDSGVLVQKSSVYSTNITKRDY